MVKIKLQFRFLSSFTGSVRNQIFLKTPSQRGESRKNDNKKPQRNYNPDILTKFALINFYSMVKMNASTSYFSTIHNLRMSEKLSAVPKVASKFATNTLIPREP